MRTLPNTEVSLTHAQGLAKKQMSFAQIFDLTTSEVSVFLETKHTPLPSPPPPPSPPSTRYLVFDGVGALQGKRAGFGLVMDDVLSGADIDIYGLADASRRRANGLEKASHVDRAVLSRIDLSTSVRARHDFKVIKRWRGTYRCVLRTAVRA